MGCQQDGETREREAYLRSKCEPDCTGQEAWGAGKRHSWGSVVPGSEHALAVMGVGNGVLLVKLEEDGS